MKFSWKVLLSVVFVFYLLLPGRTGAEDYSELELLATQKLINAYGTGHSSPLLHVILNSRGSQITIERNGQLSSTYGMPDPSLITARSVLTDIKQANLSIEAFSELAKKHNEDTKKRQLQTEPQKRSTDIERSFNPVPLAFVVNLSGY